MVIKIEDREDKYNQGGDQPIRWEEKFFFVASKGEERAHLRQIDRRSLE